MKRGTLAIMLSVFTVLSTVRIGLAEAPDARDATSKSIETRGKRTLLINSVAFSGSAHPIVTSGSLLQISIRKGQLRMAEVTDNGIGRTGAVIQITDTLATYVPPTYYVHLLHTSGATIGGATRGASGYVQLGLLKRREPQIGRFVGVGAHALYEPWSVGPVVRAEILDNIGVNLGWMFDADSGDTAEGFYVSVDYFFKLLEDLNLVPES